MKINYEEFVNALAKPGVLIKEELTPSDAHILHMAIGIAGEAGELLDAIKKAVIYRKPIDMENVIEELGDLEFYMQGLRAGLEIDRETTIADNVSKLMKRYKSLTYSDASAQNRADKA